MRRHFLLIAALFSSVCFAVDWRPVTPGELSQKTPKIDPAADAEAIFWDVRIEDRVMGGDLSLSLLHYIRIKIFTDRGKEEYTTIEIPRTNRRNIGDISARTIKADGSIIELKKDAIFDRQLVKIKGAKLNGKSFALPNVEAGDIIEYRYRETHDGESASHMRLYFQRELPMWSVTYHIKPLNVPWLPYTMRSMAFQCEHPAFQRESDGFFSTTVNNVAAFKQEPNMPPEDQLRAWMLIYYEEDKKIDAEKYWREIGRNDYSRFKPLIKPDDAVKRMAAELVSGETDPEDKLAALDLYCRTKVRNYNNRVFHLSADERKGLKENKSPGDTLKQLAGSGLDVDLLFAAMANAAGFDARMARVPDRGDTFFSPQRPTAYFLRNLSVAVKVSDKWLFFDPSTPYLERGMLRWQEEGTQALISDPKEGLFVMTQFLQPARSKRARKAALKLLDDGTLEGTLTYTYTGHVGHAQKEEYLEMTAAQQEEDWKDSLQRRLSTAEIADFEIQNVVDPLKPVTIRHTIKVPGYATRTGKRMLLQPAFFERNLLPRFTEAARKWDLYFSYGWSEEDDVTIDLPEGWVSDQPSAPASANLGSVGKYSVSLKQTPDGHRLVYHREFEWGRDSKLVLPVTAYADVKKVFTFMHDQDDFTVTLKPEGGSNDR